MVGNIMWLASYPKSGNTWLRVFLSNYIRNQETPVSINDIDFGWLAANRDLFDEAVGIASAHLTMDEIDEYRPAFHCYLSQQSNETRFIKVHDAYTHNRDGEALFPVEATAGVLYLIRNPLDVAISYAHHCAWPITRTIEEMNREQSTLARNDKKLSVQLHQRLTTWSTHVRSWTEQTALPIHIVRYEDMVASPVETFTKIVRFAQLSFSPERVQKALEFSSFDKLQAQEANDGFAEKSSLADTFFRRGLAGEWRERLKKEQQQHIIDHHGTMMTRFGYREPDK